MIQQSPSLGNTEDLPNINEFTREPMETTTTEICSGMCSTSPQYLVVTVAATRQKYNLTAFCFFFLFLSKTTLKHF